MSRNTIKHLALCYVFALLLWVVFCAVGMLRESGEQMELNYEDFTSTSIKLWENPDDPKGLWFVSTDSDPVMEWKGDLYLDRVELRLLHSRKPGNGIELYYLKPGQTDYRESQLAYAKNVGEGVYRFDLGGVQVSGIRIDPDSVGGVVTRFDGVTLNAPKTMTERLTPSAGQGILLLLLPFVACALFTQLAQWVKPQND